MNSDNVEDEPLIDSLAEIIVRDEEVPLPVVEVVGRVLLAEKFGNVEWLHGDDKASN